MYRDPVPAIMQRHVWLVLLCAFACKKAQPSPPPPTETDALAKPIPPAPPRAPIGKAAALSEPVPPIPREGCDRAWPLTSDAVACVRAETIDVVLGSTVVYSIGRRWVKDVANGSLLAFGGCTDIKARAICELRADREPTEHRLPEALRGSNSVHMGFVRLNDGRLVASDTSAIAIFRPGAAPVFEDVNDGLNLDRATRCSEAHRCFFGKVGSHVQRTPDGLIEVVLERDYPHSGDPPKRSDFFRATFAIDATTDRIEWRSVREVSSPYISACEAGWINSCPYEARRASNAADRAWFHSLGCFAYKEESCVELVHALRKGDGIRADPARAQKLLEDWCNVSGPPGRLRGYPRTGYACVVLAADLTAPGRPPADIARARSLLSSACKAYSAMSCGRLGAIDEDLEPRDPAAALASYQAGCDLAAGRLGAFACYRLGRAHLEGRLGLPPDESEGLRLLEKACNAHAPEPLACALLKSAKGGP